MNDIQKARLNSLLKSDDFLDDNVAEIVIITQVPPLALQLKNTIASIYTSGAKGESDRTGVTINKSSKRSLLIEQLLLIQRAGAAFYMTTDADKFKIFSKNPSTIDKTDGNSLYMHAKEIEEFALADGANYVGYTALTIAPEITLLHTLMEQFADVIQDPKRAIEAAAAHNEQITPLINEGFAIREQIDVYLQTLIATKPLFYSEWEKSLSIDDAGSDTPVALAMELNVDANETLNVDYAAIAIEPNTEIKLLNNGVGDLIYGFSADNINFAASQTVAANSQKRITANALGFDALTTSKLMIRNANAIALDCVLEFYVV